MIAHETGWNVSVLFLLSLVKVRTVFACLGLGQLPGSFHENHFFFKIILVFNPDRSFSLQNML